MAKKWVEVASSPAYQALAPEQQEEARSQYWNEVIAPQVPEQERATVRQQFDADTSPTVNWPGAGSMEIPITGGQLEPEKAPDPTEGMSTLQKMGAGAGKSVVDTYRGAKQFATQALLGQAAAGSMVARKAGLNQLADLVDTGAGRNLLTSLTGQQADIDEAKRLDAPLMDTKAGIAGNALGYLGQLAAGGIALRGTSLAGAALPRTVAGNALQGAGLGAVQPVATGENRLANIAVSAAGGAGGALAGKAIGAGVNGLAKLMRPSALTRTERAAGQVIMRDASDPQGLMTGAPSAIPGVVRSLGEETMDQGVMGLEQALRGPNRALFAPRDLANNAARVDAISQFAGDDATMAAAKAARDTASGAARTQAMQAGPVSIANTVKDLDDAIKSMEGRPAVQGALQQIKGVLVDETGQPETRIFVLENARQTISDMLSGKLGGDSAAALKGSRELIQIRDSLNNEIAQQVPEFGQYLNAYRQGSVPINRMQIGQYLLTPKTGSAVTDIAGNQQLTPARFSALARDMDGLAAKATKFPKAKASSILQTQDIETITNIADDLAREFNRMKVTGGNSATSERNAILTKLGRTGLNGALNSIPGGRAIGTVLDGLIQNGNEAIQQKLAYLIANPAEARAVLKELQPRQRSAVTRALMEMSNASGAISTAGANSLRQAEAPPPPGR